MIRKSILQPDCPIPKLDFDIITLGHGSGGILSNQLLESGVFKLLGNELLDKKHDGATFQLNARVAMSTDSFVVSPIFFAGGNIGDLAVNGTVNDLAMCGALPKYLSLSFILEEGLPMEELWEVLVAIKTACEYAGVQVVTGDTKVVERGKGDKIFINTTGIGEVHPHASIDPLRMSIGDKIILSGPPARHGVAIMSMRRGLEFETSITSDTRPLHRIINSLLDTFGSAIHLLRDPTRGGIASVLNEIAKAGSMGIEIDEHAFPIEEEVAGACEMLGLDPLYIANEGLFIAVVDAHSAGAFLQQLQHWQHGAQASVIGEVVADHRGQVIMNSTIGGRRVINMLSGELLPRIC